eukprot:15642652-Heterocapsa_arctica.AAC.1
MTASLPSVWWPPRCASGKGERRIGEGGMPELRGKNCCARSGLVDQPRGGPLGRVAELSAGMVGGWQAQIYKSEDAMIAQSIKSQREMPQTKRRRAVAPGASYEMQRPHEQRAGRQL